MSTGFGDCPLPGRDAELECLRRAWRRARSGRGQVVLLSGEPGVGKTAVARRMAAEAEGDGATVVAGGTEEHPTGHYQPLAGALAGAVSRAPAGLLDGGNRLGFLLPGLPTASRPAAAPIAGDSAAEREEAFDSVGDLVGELARRTPLVLLLDDLHRADRSTVLLLDRVIEATRHSPVLVVASYCDTAVDRVHPLTVLLDLLAGDAELSAVHVEGLDPDVVAAIIGDPQVAAVLARRGQGNPLYIRELLHDVRHAGYRLDPGGGASVDRGVGLDPDLLPRSTEELLGRRISRLSPASRRLLGVAAVVGRPFDLELVAAVAEIGKQRLRSAAAEATAAGILEPVDAGDGRYRFAHSVARSAVYGRLPSLSRVRLHLRVGQVLADSARDPHDRRGAMEIAAHFWAASPVGHSDVGAAFNASAGDDAMAVLAYETAADLYGRALALLDGSAPSSWVARCHLLLSLAEAQRQALEPTRARQALLDAVTIAEAHGHSSLLERSRAALDQVGPVMAVAGSRRSAP